MKTQQTTVFPKIAVLAILVLAIFSQLKTSAQEGAYWMGVSTENPALIGTPSDWVWGTTTFADIPNYDEPYNRFSLFSDYKISPKAGSVGANFMRAAVGDQTSFLAQVLYAYTINFKKENRELNIGTSFGFEGLESDYSEYSNYVDELYNDNPKANYLKTNVGILYRTRKLNLGLSYGAYSELKNEYSSYRLTDNYVSFLTAYRFIIKEKFVIEPNLRLVFQDDDNDGYLGLHFEYDDLVWIGYETAGSDNVKSIMAGADISKRFRVAVNYSYTKKYQSERVKYYQFSLGYKLN